MSSLDGKKSLMDTEAWQSLQRYFDLNKNNINIMDMFQRDKDRFNKFSVKLTTPLDGEFLVDYSKNRINEEVMRLLMNLAKERGVDAARDAMFSGERINFTEDRAVLHVALRNRSNIPMKVSTLIIGIFNGISIGFTLIEWMQWLINHGVYSFIWLYLVNRIIEYIIY